MSTTPVVQLLSRSNYEEQHLVSILSTAPLLDLAPSSIRIKTSILSLTANNLTYGRVGHLLSIWDIYPLPSSLPPQYSDPNKFGRIGAWGYATVLASTVPSVEVGTQIFGLLPIGTLPHDMEIRINPEVPGQFFEVSKQREKVMSLYNQYLFYPPIQRTQEQKQSQGFDTLYQVFFMTSYLMNRFALPSDPKEFLQPGTSDDGWTVEKGQVDEKTIVLIFADSGKTALSFAYLMKNCRSEGKKPKIVIGIGSSASREFVRGTGLYDKLLTYDSDASGDLVAELGLNTGSKVAVCEFGSRGGAGNRWASKLREQDVEVVQLIVAGEAVSESPEKATERFLARGKSGASGFNASATRDKALKVVGEKLFLEEFRKDWLSFKERGLVKGTDMIWGEGMEDVGRGWEKLCKSEVGANQGLVFSLD